MSVTTSFLDRLTQLPGFADALRKVGWLEGRDGALTFPRFERHNGQTAKNRALTSKRVANHKAKNSNDPVTLDALPREEKRREEKKKNKETEPREASPPGVLDCDQFREAWAKYEAYRRAAKLKPLKPVSIKAKWAEMADWGLDAALASIQATIANGWQGLFPPTSKKGANTNARHPQATGKYADAF